MDKIISSIFPIIYATLIIMVPVTIIYYVYKWMQAYLTLKQEQTELLEEILEVLREKKEEN
jgi:cell division protein FtsL